MPFVSWPVKQGPAVGLFEVAVTYIKCAFQRGTLQGFFVLGFVTFIPQFTKTFFVYFLSPPIPFSTTPFPQLCSYRSLLQMITRMLLCSYALFA